MTEAMVSRRGARPVWLPALLLWAPALLLGVALMTGIDVDVDPVADAHRVRIEFPGIASWMDDGLRFWSGVALLGFGALMLVLRAWRPDPARIPLTVALFPWYLVGGLALGAAALLAAFGTAGHAFDGGTEAAQWRFLVEARGSLWNRITWVVAGLASLALLGLSFGGTWRFFGSPSSPQAGAGQDAHQA